MVVLPCCSAPGSTKSLACGFPCHRILSTLKSLVTCLTGLLPGEAWRPSVRGWGCAAGKPSMGTQFVWLNSGLIMACTQPEVFFPSSEEETRRQKAYSS